ETGLMEELFLEVRSRSYGLRQVNGQHYPMWDVILAEKAEAEPNLTLLLNTRVAGVETASDDRAGYETRVTGLLAFQQSTELAVRITPTTVIDATGDGFIALQAGAPFRYGREARSEFDERWAPEEADDIVLGSTIMFAAKDVARPAPFVPPAWAHSFPTEESLPFRPHEDIQSGYWWLEWGGRLNTIADNETIRKELHAAVFGVWDHIKNHCTVPGVRERAANWALDWIGHIPGKRESRRFEGDYILRERDLVAGLNAVPADVVAYGGWAIDLHAPDGVYSPDRPCTQPPLPDLYGIPLRGLSSRTVSNLYLAGRNISQTHVAHGSTRVMKTCAVIGEAAGTAAAFALREGVSPRELANCDDCVRAIQRQLLRQGAYLPLVANDDPHDLARLPGVIVSATSQATLDLDPAAGWEAPGISTAESAGLAQAVEQYPDGRELPLDRLTGQSIVISADHIDTLSLPLTNASSQPTDVAIRIRQAAHLRDFGPEESSGDLWTGTANVPPGSSPVVIDLDRLTVTPGTPVVVILEPHPALSWSRSWQEPPGTQAARWDDDLGYWRWEHGTLGFALEPVSAPYGPEEVLSGVTRPEIGANVWISDPNQPLPQAWELHWPQPQTIETIEITFDSQLSGWIWEGAFPLIPRAWDLQVLKAGSSDWLTNDSREQNAQRRAIHQFPAEKLDAVRIAVRATQGGRTARIVEVRCYGPQASASARGRAT
nr:FAD-dependent oxidoreductase [Chloroflexia bacterium]